jgi:hypothetical protein
MRSGKREPCSLQWRALRLVDTTKPSQLLTTTSNMKRSTRHRHLPLTLIISKAASISKLAQSSPFSPFAGEVRRLIRTMARGGPASGLERDGSHASVATRMSLEA